MPGTSGLRGSTGSSSRAASPEKARPEIGRAGGYYVRGFAWLMGGLDELSPEEVKVVKPFAWPIQQEEWKLDYWIAQGFNIFVVGDEEIMLHHPVEVFRSFINEIKQRCDLMEVIPIQPTPLRPVSGRLPGLQVTGSTDVINASDFMTWAQA